MMVLLDLTRSYDSLRRKMEASEHKRCVSPSGGCARWGPRGMECPCPPWAGPQEGAPNPSLAKSLGGRGVSSGC